MGHHHLAIGDMNGKIGKNHKEMEVLMSNYGFERVRVGCERYLLVMTNIAMVNPRTKWWF